MRPFPRSLDVGYLLTLLRVAKKGNDLGAQRAIIERLLEIGVLREAAIGEDVTHANLREQVNTILKVKDLPLAKQIRQ